MRLCALFRRRLLPRWSRMRMTYLTNTNSAAYVLELSPPLRFGPLYASLACIKKCSFKAEELPVTTREGVHKDTFSRAGGSKTSAGSHGTQSKTDNALTHLDDDMDHKLNKVDCFSVLMRVGLSAYPPWTFPSNETTTAPVIFQCARRRASFSAFCSGCRLI